MPVFGNRVVVGTASVKHIKKFNEEMNAREDALAEWKVERKERKEKLEVLQDQINQSRRNSTISELSLHKAAAAMAETEKDTAEPEAQDESATAVVVVDEDNDEKTESEKPTARKAICGRCVVQ